MLQLLFAGVTKGWMAQIVSQGDGFCKVFIQAEATGDRPADLGDF